MHTALRIDLIARRRVCSNALFDVFLDEISDDSGQRVSDYLSIVPRVADREGVTGVAVLPVRADGWVGLMRVSRHPQGTSAWEIPKGFVDAGEQPLRAAMRELQEETGFAPTQPHMVDLGHIAPVPGVIQARVRLFAALAVVPSGKGRDEELGHVGIEFFAPQAAFAMADQGMIEEPCTLVAMYRLRDRV
jgi:ADP-ribose pyrophosphatase